MNEPYMSSCFDTPHYTGGDNSSWKVFKDASDASPKEFDPNGKNPHESGAKLDAGKIRPGLVLGGFARALKEVVKVGTYGANKYTDNGWMEVPNGIQRYEEAKMRHWLAQQTGEEVDPDTGLYHAAHEAWNALAKLDLMIRELERKQTQ